MKTEMFVQVAMETRSFGMDGLQMKCVMFAIER